MRRPLGLLASGSGIRRGLGGLLLAGGFLGVEFLGPLLLLLGALFSLALLLLRGGSGGLGFLLLALGVAGGLLLLDDLEIVVLAFLSIRRERRGRHLGWETHPGRRRGWG